MIQTTVTDFIKHAKTYFDSVERGEIVRVTRYGKIIAEVRPVHEGFNKKTKC